MIITQDSTEVKYDSFGWPIDPATGESYEAKDLVDNPDLPLPRDKFPRDLVERGRKEAAGEGTPAPKRRKRRPVRKGKPSKRINYAARVLVGPLDAGMEATAELVERVNKKGRNESRQIPWFYNGRFVKYLEVT